MGRVTFRSVYRATVKQGHLIARRRMDIATDRCLDGGEAFLIVAILNHAQARSVGVSVSLFVHLPCAWSREHSRTAIADDLTFYALVRFLGKRIGRIPFLSHRITKVCNPGQA